MGSIQRHCEEQSDATISKRENLIPIYIYNENYE